MAAEAQIFAFCLFSSAFSLLPSSLYICRDSSTTVENSLQISSFMQNKANFGKAQMNVNKVLTKDYENKTLSGSGKNKANTNPNKANLLNAQINVNKVLTRDYENIANCALAENKPNTKPIQTQTNPTRSELVEPISPPGSLVFRCNPAAFFVLVLSCQVHEFNVWKQKGITV